MKEAEAEKEILAQKTSWVEEREKALKQQFDERAAKLNQDSSDRDSTLKQQYEERTAKLNQDHMEREAALKQQYEERKAKLA